MRDKKIRTVLGDIRPDKLGWCQCHEHLFLEKGKSFEVSNALCMDDLEKSLKELAGYMKAGGNSCVDAQPVGCGRMAEALASASQISGVNIIAATGFHKLCFHEEDSPALKLDEDGLTELYIREITCGMRVSPGGCEKVIPAKAGIIKVAVERGGIKCNAVYEKLFRSAVGAAKETGAPVLAHFDPGTDVEELLGFIEARGVPSNKLIACHLDRVKCDAAYHKEAAQAGVYLEYDTIHRLKYHDDQTELRLIKEMIEDGFTDNLLLSLDTTAARLKAYGGEIGLDYILTSFSKQLDGFGVGPHLVRQMMITNPAKALGF